MELVSSFSNALIQVEDPAVYGQTEWLGVQIHGQSFMLHQVRQFF
jgi:tRNA pseudouridine38-40 synthase